MYLMTVFVVFIIFRCLRAVGKVGISIYKVSSGHSQKYHNILCLSSKILDNHCLTGTIGHFQKYRNTLCLY